MGTKCFTCLQLSTSESIQIGKNLIHSFLFVKLLQKGKVSDVWEVKSLKTGDRFALKKTKKIKLISKKGFDMIRTERQIGEKVMSEFTVNIILGFQDKNHLYSLMEFILNGNLRQFIKREDKLEESSIKFVIICILIALENIHQKGILHMDIKPENILVDSKLYCRLIDFSVSCYLNGKKPQKIVGTQGYQAPELYINDDPNKKKTNFTTDFYSLGIVCFELVTGFNKTYWNEFQKTRMKAMLSNKGFLSQNCINFITKLLQEDSEKRLGFSGISSIWNHPWLKDENIDMYRTKKKKSALKIDKMSKQVLFDEESEANSQYDSRYFNMMLERDEFQNKFKIFDWKLQRHKFFSLPS